MPKLDHPYAIVHTRTAAEIESAGPNAVDNEHQLYLYCTQMIKSLNFNPEKNQIVLVDFRIMYPEAQGIVIDQDIYSHEPLGEYSKSDK